MDVAENKTSQRICTDQKKTGTGCTALLRKKHNGLDAALEVQGCWTWAEDSWEIRWPFYLLDDEQMVAIRWGFRHQPVENNRKQTTSLLIERGWSPSGPLRVTVTTVRWFSCSNSFYFIFVGCKHWPASSEWPFDSPNGGPCSPPAKVT